MCDLMILRDQFVTSVYIVTLASLQRLVHAAIVTSLELAGKMSKHLPPNQGNFYINYSTKRCLQHSGTAFNTRSTPLGLYSHAHYRD